MVRSFEINISSTIFVFVERKSFLSFRESGDINCILIDWLIFECLFILGGAEFEFFFRKVVSSACKKQCLTVYELFDLFSNHPKFFITNFEQVYYSLIFKWTSIFLFFVTVVYHTFYIFYNLEAMLWKCYHVTMKSPHFLFYAKLKQRWFKIQISTSRRRCEYDVAVTMLHQSFHYNIHNMLWGEFFIQLWDNVGTLLWFDVVVSTLWRWEFDAGI